MIKYVLPFLFLYTSVNTLSIEQIRGGRDTKKGEFSHHVTIIISNLGNCGGAIISHEHIITAAHCVANKTGNYFHDSIFIYAGINNLGVPLESMIIREVEKTYVHHDYFYSKQVFFADIAVLKVNKELDVLFDSHIDVVSLPLDSLMYENVEANVTGLAMDDISALTYGINNQIIIQHTDQIRYLTVNVLSHENCSKAEPIVIDQTFMCAQTKFQASHHGPEGVCRGDSGSPLVYGDFVIGVQSNGPFDCDESFQPSVYTRVSEFIPLIFNALDDVCDESYMFCYTHRNFAR